MMVETPEPKIPWDRLCRQNAALILPGVKRECGDSGGDQVHVAVVRAATDQDAVYSVLETHPALVLREIAAWEVDEDYAELIDRFELGRVYDEAEVRALVPDIEEGWS